MEVYGFGYAGGGGGSGYGVWSMGLLSWSGLGLPSGGQDFAFPFTVNRVPEQTGGTNLYITYIDSIA